MEIELSNFKKYKHKNGKIKATLSILDNNKYKIKVSTPNVSVISNNIETVQNNIYDEIDNRIDELLEKQKNNELSTDEQKEFRRVKYHYINVK